MRIPRAGSPPVAVGLRLDTEVIQPFDSEPLHRVAPMLPWWDFNVILRQIDAARDHTELNRLFSLVDMRARLLYEVFLFSRLWL